VQRLVLALIAVALWAALSSTAIAQTTLTTPQYGALDAAYTGFVSIDSARVARIVAYKHARAACGALDSADPLLGPYRHQCTANIDLLADAADFFRCPSRTLCMRRARRSRHAAGELVARTVATNAAVKSAGLASACAAALRTTKAELHVTRHLLDFFHLSELVFPDSAPWQRNRLLLLGRDIDPRGTREAAALHRRTAFRAACAPPAA
jgi:hypothetical protein